MRDSEEKRSFREAEFKIVENIRARRLALGYTQAEVASYLGIQADYYNRIENHSKRLSLEHMYRAAQLLDTTMDSLLCSDVTPLEQLLKNSALQLTCDGFDAETVIELLSLLVKAITQHTKRLETDSES